MTIKILKSSKSGFNGSFLGFSKKILYSAIAGFALTFVFCFLVSSAKAGSLSIVEPSEGQRFHSPMPKIAGIAEGTENVFVFIDNVLNGSAKVTNGKFEYFPFLPISSGNHSISVKTTNNNILEQETQSVDDVNIYIVPNPSPTILYPSQGQTLGKDRVWVGGVAQNNSLIRVFVDNEEFGRVSVKNHKSKTGSFSIEIKGLSVGGHVIYAIARDEQGKESFASDVIVINVLEPTPAPILEKPVVNSDSGIERPFIVGLTKNNTDVSIVIDGKIEHTIYAGFDNSGVVSFAWQPQTPFSLGTHKIEAFASENGKLSNNSNMILWQVGYISDARFNENKATNTEIDQDISVLDQEKDENIVVDQENKNNEDSEVYILEEESTDLTIKDDLGSVLPKENPVVLDDQNDKIAQNDEYGRIMADDDYVLGDKDNNENKGKIAQTDNDVVEIAPGAVVRKEKSDAQNSSKNDVNVKKFTLNTSLVMGVVILIFLLLSILVWYIQEKRDALSDKVVNIFREDEDSESSIDVNGNYVGHQDASVGNPVGIFAPDFKKDKEFDSDKEKQEIEEDPSFYNKEEDANQQKTEKQETEEDLPPPPPPMF